jgi:hypothetical protein
VLVNRVGNKAAVLTLLVALPKKKVELFNTMSERAAVKAKAVALVFT